VDRAKAAQLGIQPEQVDSALYSAFGQRQVSVVYNDRDQFHVVPEASPHGPQLVVQKFLPAVFDVFREPDPVDVQQRGEGQE
jgi:hypothetical protein